jgi:predicted transcriptional regulator of viral defense system
MTGEECISQRIDVKCTPRGHEAAEVDRRSAGIDRVIGDMASRQHGVVARWQLGELGVGRGAIEGRMARGMLHRLHQGVYAVGHRASTVEGRWMAAVLAVGPDAALSHRSAGQLWRLLPISSTVPEITRPGYGRARPGIRVHRSRIPPDEAGAVRGIPVTSVSRTLLDLAAVLDKRRLERALNEVEVLRLSDRLSLPDLLNRYPRRRGSAVLRALLRDDETTRGVTRSELEERFVAFVDGHGLPRPRLNVDLAVNGRFFRVDCLWVEHRMVIELDGRAAHGTAKAFEKDRERDRLLMAEGWRVIRVTWRQLRDDAPAVAADLRKLLAPTL